MQLGVADAFVGRAPAAGDFGFGGQAWREGTVHDAGEPFKIVQLGDGGVIHRVENLPGGSQKQGGDDDADQIIAVDHVQVTAAVAFNAGLAAQEGLEPVAARGAVNAGHAQNHGREARLRGGQQEFFRFHQYLAGGHGGFGGILFGHHGAVVLAVNAGTAGIDVFLGRRIGKPGDQVAVAFVVNLPVIRRVAAAGGGAVDHPVEITGQSGQGGGLGDIGEEGLDAGGPHFLGGAGIAPEAEDGAAFPGQGRAERQADITAANNQNAHKMVLARKRKRDDGGPDSARLSGRVSFGSGLTISFSGLVFA